MSLSGKIYKLISIDEYFYIGSTITTLNSRFSKHKSDAKNVRSKVYTYYNKIGWNNVKIELIEEIRIDNRNNLLLKESEYINKFIKNDKCLNTRIPLLNIINKNIGLIYKLICSDNYFYIGSTENKLEQRLSQHKCDAKRINRKLYNHINKIGWNNVKIELIEKIEFTDKKELIIKENEYIKENKLNSLCLNQYKSYDEKTSKIYIIKCPDNYFYIGSTKSLTLDNVISNHKYESKFKKTKYYNHINNIGWDNIIIELLEELPNQEKKDLIIKQNEYICKMYSNMCLNTQTPLYEEKTKQKKKERRKKMYEINKEKIKLTSINYYNKNKEKIQKQRKNKKLLIMML